MNKIENCLVGIMLLFLLFIGGTYSLTDAEEPAIATPYKVCYTSLIQDFQWVGLNEDMVGNGAEPDGINDGHFQLTLNLAQPAVISRISLYQSNETGNLAVQPYIWDTDPSTSWSFLGVYYNGTMINNDLALSRLSGQAQLDLYARDMGVFKPGNHFGVQAYIQVTDVTAV